MTILRWWPCAIGVIVGSLGGVGLFLSAPPAYSASTALFIGSPVSADSAGAYAGDLFGQQRAVSYSQLFTSDDLATKVIDDLSLQLDPVALAGQVTARQLPKTVLLEVSVTDASPQRAADIANAYAANFAAYVSRLETPAASNQSVAKISVVRKATAPTAPSSPNALIDIGGGLAAGALLGGLAQWTAVRLGRRRAETPARATSPRRHGGPTRRADGRTYRPDTGSHRAPAGSHRADSADMDFATQELPKGGTRTHA